ncbi:hypothetical protein CAPTEDRAFT_119480 [Capitella teleta]|uniref:Ionotropic glutamate receptor C-terminal domain-containing protein n=1 Tax=Capitella teleta TaxID=283909 RepID=R7U7X4_CAPTE|nr:hypothetical protein CAPTEDRAFT_119480 [Capitella teleta]|eukprot:ELT99225.1 hypothetical protein CAPTEDRAFT_119480 [Capitella teleta]
MIQTEPYLEVRKGKTGNSKFGGFIPAFLRDLKDRKAIPANYQMQLAKDGRYGYYDNDKGRWMGMIGEVMKTSVADLAAGGIQVTATRSNVVDFSIVWANATFVLVTHVDNGFDTVQDVLDSPHSLGGIDGGSSLQAISREFKEPFSSMWSKIESDPNANVATAKAGIARARKGNYTVVLESLYADYMVHKHCELKTIDMKLSVHSYAFAMTKGSALKPELDRGIQEMINDGSLDKLRRKYWKVPCVSGQSAVIWSPAVVVAFVVSALLLRSS